MIIQLKSLFYYLHSPPKIIFIFILIYIIIQIIFTGNIVNATDIVSSSPSSTCTCPPRQVKYVAIEIPKIVNVPAPAPSPATPPKVTLVPITIPFMMQVPSPEPIPPAPEPAPTPVVSGWGVKE